MRKGAGGKWRRVAESNRPRRICNPLHNRFANAPQGIQKKEAKLPFLAAAGLVTGCECGAGNEARTRDLNLGKVALYQLSYSRVASLAL